MALRGVRRPSLRLVGAPANTGLANTGLANTDWPTPAGIRLADHEAADGFDPVRRLGPGSHAARRGRNAARRCRGSAPRDGGRGMPGLAEDYCTTRHF
jgi:hypothetical protein